MPEQPSLDEVRRHYSEAWTSAWKDLIDGIAEDTGMTRQDVMLYYICNALKDLCRMQSEAAIPPEMKDLVFKVFRQQHRDTREPWGDDA